MRCAAVIYSIDAPLPPVPCIISINLADMPVTQAGYLDVPKFFKDYFEERVQVDPAMRIVIRKDGHNDFIVTTTNGHLSGKVIMAVNLPDGIAPADLGIVFDS